jgi:hypothetical protein
MKMSQLQNIETNEKSFSEMSFQQKRELLFLYEDKLGVIFKARHLNKIFGNIKDETFTHFSYQRKSGYVDSHDASFLIDFMVCRILGESAPSMSASKEEKELFINKLHDKISKEGWVEQLYSAGGLSGKPMWHVH